MDEIGKIETLKQAKFEDYIYLRLCHSLLPIFGGFYRFCRVSESFIKLDFCWPGLYYLWPVDKTTKK